MASEDDPLSAGVSEAAALVPDATEAILPSQGTPSGLQAKALAIGDCLDGES